jgi:hypothetical protein
MPDSAYAHEKTFSLFGSGNDSVSLICRQWGVFKLGITRAFIQHDTLFKVFTIASTIDSAKWGALYVADADRPLSVSGTTSITGNAFLPKAGIQEAYVNNIAYKGDKRIVIGSKFQSDKQLPALDTGIINLIDKNFTVKGDTIAPGDSVQRSFLKPVKIFDFGKQVKTLAHIKLTGNIILRSDTTLILDSTALLNQVLVFARSIQIKGGFRGQCQLFARDSVSIGKRCRFDYPSAIGVIRLVKPKVNSQEKIVLNAHCIFSGLLFNYEKNETDLKPLISVGKEDTVRGQLYSQGAAELKDTAAIQGSVIAKSLLYRTSFTLYENYLINVTLDAPALSPYYLGSGMLPVAAKKKKVLQWLEGN